MLERLAGELLLGYRKVELPAEVEKFCTEVVFQKFACVLLLLLATIWMVETSAEGEDTGMELVLGGLACALSLLVVFWLVETPAKVEETDTRLALERLVCVLLLLMTTGLLVEGRDVCAELVFQRLGCVLLLLM